MKYQNSIRAIQKLVVVSAIFSATITLASTQPLSGSYQLNNLGNECVIPVFGTFLSEILISADDLGLQLRTNEAIVFEASVGREDDILCHGRQGCYNDEQQFYESAYAAAGAQFKTIKGVREVLNWGTESRYLGEIKFILEGNSLKISSTAGNQFDPVAETSCLFKKSL